MSASIPAYRLTAPNGLTSDLQLVDVQTGERIRNISRIVVDLEPDDVVRATVTIVGVELDLNLLVPGVTVLNATVDEPFKQVFVDPDAKYVQYAEAKCGELEHANTVGEP